MKKLIGLLLAITLLAALVIPAAAEDQGRDMYVYTQNGKSLLVRSSMSTTEDNMIGSLPFGTKVVTYGSPQPGWTVIDYGDGSFSAYVMSRFLVRTKPASSRPSSSGTKSSSGTDSKNFDTTSAATVEQINTLLASAKPVEPYSVTVRPVRASGWVYMRWIPSRYSRQIATYSANQQLTVIAELKDWYQVQDPATDRVGFVYKSYIQ
ncbi:MAG: SH3 domain-containing protein [Clostridia bacterium]|nr:SH3 domain-containing protein [Clostridia bacterium]